MTVISFNLKIRNLPFLEVKVSLSNIYTLYISIKTDIRGKKT